MLVSEATKRETCFKTSKFATLLLSLLQVLSHGQVTTSFDLCVDSTDGQRCEAELPQMPQLLRQESRVEASRLSKDSVLLQSRADELVNRAASTATQRLEVEPIMQEGRQLPRSSPLCDPSIVDQTCRKLGGSKENPSVSWALIADLLSANSLAVAQDSLGFPQGQPAVGCMELCAAAKDYVLRIGKVLPPLSDMACRTAGVNTTCDVEVDPDDLKRRLGAMDSDSLPDEGPQIVPEEDTGDTAHAGEARLFKLSAGVGSQGGLGKILGRAHPSDGNADGNADGLDYSV